MKSILKIFTFSAIGLWFVSIFPGYLDFGNYIFGKTFFLVFVAFSFLNLVLPKVLNVLGFFSHGLGLIFMRALVYGITLFVLTSFLPELSVMPYFLRSFSFFDTVSEPVFVSYLISNFITGITYSIFYGYLGWISGGKIKK